MYASHVRVFGHCNRLTWWVFLSHSSLSWHFRSNQNVILGAPAVLMTAWLSEPIIIVPPYLTIAPHSRATTRTPNTSIVVMRTLGDCQLDSLPIIVYSDSRATMGARATRKQTLPAPFRDNSNVRNAFAPLLVICPL